MNILIHLKIVSNFTNEMQLKDNEEEKEMKHSNSESSPVNLHVNRTMRSNMLDSNKNNNNSNGKRVRFDSN